MSNQADATQAIWWKTYSPPIWLLNGKNEMLKTHDVMGMKAPEMLRELERLATCHTPSGGRSAKSETNGTYLIAPLSATFLDKYVSNQEPFVRFEEVWRYREHLNLDDLDFGDDGFWNTIKRVIGRKGLGVWRVSKACKGKR